MAKFIVVESAPEQLDKAEHVIDRPTFTDIIEKVMIHRPTAKRTAPNQMREILGEIQDKYQVDLNVFKIPLSLYDGIEFKDYEHYNHILTQMLLTERPNLFEHILEYNIKNRPYGTKLIYFIGRWNETGPFFKNGIDTIEEKDIDEYLGRTPKEPENSEPAKTPKNQTKKKKADSVEEDK